MEDGRCFSTRRIFSGAVHARLIATTNNRRRTTASSAMRRVETSESCTRRLPPGGERLPNPSIATTQRDGAEHDNEHLLSTTLDGRRGRRCADAGVGERLRR
jgi:hypothetical protein